MFFHFGNGTLSPRIPPPPKKNVFTLRNRPFESEIIIRIFVHNLIDFVSTNSQKHFSFALILVFFSILWRKDCRNGRDFAFKLLYRRSVHICCLGVWDDSRAKGENLFSELRILQVKDLLSLVRRFIERFSGLGEMFSRVEWFSTFSIFKTFTLLSFRYFLWVAIPKNQQFRARARAANLAQHRKCSIFFKITPP